VELLTIVILKSLVRIVHFLLSLVHQVGLVVLLHVHGVLACVAHGLVVHGVVHLRVHHLRLVSTHLHGLLVC